MFFVVEFADQSVEAVPDNWLIENGTQCLWPPFKGKHFQQAAQQKMAPGNTWNTFKLKRTMAKCDTYAVASAKANKAAYQSDLNTDNNSDEEVPAKRPRNRPRHFSPAVEKKHGSKSGRYPPEASTTFLNLAPTVPVGLSGISMLPPSPFPEMPDMAVTISGALATTKPDGLFVVSPQTSFSQSVSFHSAGQPQTPAVRATMPFNEYPPAAPTGMQRRDYPPAAPTGMHHQDYPPPMPTGMSRRDNPPATPTGMRRRDYQPATPTGMHRRPVLGNTFQENMPANPITLDNIFSEITRLSADVGSMMGYMKTVMSTMNIINEKVDFAIRKIHAVNVSGGHAARLDVATCPEGLVLPADSLRAIRDLSARLLADAALKKRLASFLATSGGMHLSETVSGIMKTLITNRLALQMNWRGNRDKQSFLDLKLSGVVCDAVRMNEATSSANNMAVEAKVKSWLRLARDRDGGRKRRYEIAAQRCSTGGHADLEENQDDFPIGQQQPSSMAHSSDPQTGNEPLFITAEWQHM